MGWRRGGFVADRKDFSGYRASFLLVIRGAVSGVLDSGLVEGFAAFGGGPFVERGIDRARS